MLCITTINLDILPSLAPLRFNYHMPLNAKMPNIYNIL